MAKIVKCPNPACGAMIDLIQVVCPDCNTELVDDTNAPQQPAPALAAAPSATVTPAATKKTIYITLLRCTRNNEWPEAESPFKWAFELTAEGKYLALDGQHNGRVTESITFGVYDMGTDPNFVPCVDLGFGILYGGFVGISKHPMAISISDQDTIVVIDNGSQNRPAIKSLQDVFKAATAVKQLTEEVKLKPQLQPDLDQAIADLQAAKDALKVNRVEIEARMADDKKTGKLDEFEEQVIQNPDVFQTGAYVFVVTLEIEPAK